MTGDDRVVYPPADSAVALAPQRLISAERVALKRADKRARKAREEVARLVGDRDFDQRLIATQAESIRRWSAAHADVSARLRRWQTAAWVIAVCALGYVLVYTHIGR